MASANRPQADIGPTQPHDRIRCLSGLARFLPRVEHPSFGKRGGTMGTRTPSSQSRAAAKNMVSILSITSRTGSSR